MHYHVNTALRLKLVIRCTDRVIIISTSKQDKLKSGQVCMHGCIIIETLCIMSLSITNIYYKSV